MSGKPVPITCRDCGQDGYHGGRGLCRTCYTAHHNAGTLHQWPSVKGDHAWQKTSRHSRPEQEPPSTRSQRGGNWRDDAACRSADPELFFPITSSDDHPQVEQAKAVCRGCPVLHDCLDWVTRNPQWDGIWAATTPRQRLLQPERTSA
ncbi:WhiB family transcriptional regulator [Nonomuraea rhodomycinica]|uniref:Transcriptional regulator WhiB n=1 Tax=Nonomuraea rhodomycinica TaxID=1712872 RepID=A0A7Y6IWA5_9ACTN|nr:WhiB family transcriptional regulator [Nonomuraea rhodomycinica]NUW45581.1 WhiB family transcriptional regulator [Nonomuraea rhodomycinica]